ncbi:MAG: ribulose-phosphate 3-epimerase [Anaerolineaceae bacterium]|nr:ribulose-phosphate 3-epimerase [Anaerolineaceae bacterium]
MNDILLSSSILSADFACLGDEIREAETAGVDWIHIDVMDGHFVPNLTMGPFIVETCRRITKLPLDVHLMVDNPEQLIELFARAGANRLSVQVESTPHIYRLLQRIRELGCHPGVVINPGTPANVLEPVLHLADLVLVMTVNPGYSGQDFLPDMCPKISQVKEMIQEQRLNCLIQVDGGITSKTLPSTYQAGARVFIAATSIFKNPAGIAAGIRELRQAVPVQEQTAP